MPVEERRRIALHRKAADAWGEEAADTLLELTTPAGHDPATRQDIADMRAAMDARFEAFEARLDGRMDSMEHRLIGVFERRIADAVTTQTRTLVISQLVALVAISGLAFGLG